MSHIESLSKQGGTDGNSIMDTDTYNSALSSLVQMTERENDKSQLDKKTRREIANSNERRRMQSINTGFMRLKSLVPTISKEKVSKVSNHGVANPPNCEIRQRFCSKPQNILKNWREKIVS